KFGPAFETRHRIGADLQDLDVQLLEFFEVRTEPDDLILSPTGECEREERDDRRAAAIVRERDFLIVVRREREIGRRGACLQAHAFLLRVRPLIVIGEYLRASYCSSLMPASLMIFANFADSPRMNCRNSSGEVGVG